MRTETKEDREGVGLLIQWVKVLQEGYTKPDLNSKENANTAGYVRDTKENLPYIKAANDKIAQMLDVDLKGLGIEKKELY